MSEVKLPICQVRIQSGVPCGSRARFFAVFLAHCLQAPGSPPVIIETSLKVCDACRKLRMGNVKQMLATDENLGVILETLKEQNMPEPEQIDIGFRMLQEAKRELVEKGERKKSMKSMLRLLNGGKVEPPPGAA